MQTQTIVTVLGGLGLFLLGMSLMTDGLTAVGGGAMRRAMRTLAGSRWRAFALGAGTTALVQSSSATTLVAIGFVGAGLLDLPAALAVVLGANVGTTSTAWIVSAIGLKVKASAFALPLIAAGAAWRLLRHGRRGVFGHALAGFGLVFLGIATLQDGMAEATAQVAVAGTAEQFGGRAVLVLVGLLMTVIAQSSSAAVAMTITALASGALDLEAAAALVIGQNVGTTVTALLGSIGGGVAVRRAAVGHLLFNVLTGLVAFAVLGPAVHFIDWVAAESATRDPAVELALFHTAFNLFGVAMVLPVLGPFARVVERMVPEPVGATAALQLSSATIAVPGAALEMARRALIATFVRALVAVESRIRPLAETGAPGPVPAASLRQLLADAQRATQFLTQLARRGAGSGRRGELVPLMHAVDHVQRLVEALGEEEHDDALRESQAVRAMAAALLPELVAARERLATDAIGPGDVAEVAGALAAASRGLAQARKDDRVRILEEVAVGARPSEDADARLGAARLVDRLGYHAWRGAHALRESALEAGLPHDATPDDPSR